MSRIVAVSNLPRLRPITERTGLNVQKKISQYSAAGEQVCAVIVKTGSPVGAHEIVLSCIVISEYAPIFNLLCFLYSRLLGTPFKIMLTLT